MLFRPSVRASEVFSCSLVDLKKKTHQKPSEVGTVCVIVAGYWGGQEMTGRKSITSPA